jgi:hypothetical protein
LHLIFNGMAINGYLLDANNSIRSIITMNQDTRMNSGQLIDIVQKIDPEAKYFVGTDEHGGGGFLHLPEK